MRISDWSSDVCSSDLRPHGLARDHLREAEDGVQGRAQLVAHQREEARLGAALRLGEAARFGVRLRALGAGDGAALRLLPAVLEEEDDAADGGEHLEDQRGGGRRLAARLGKEAFGRHVDDEGAQDVAELQGRSEEHTSELQSLMRMSYTGFCL